VRGAQGPALRFFFRSASRDASGGMLTLLASP